MYALRVRTRLQYFVDCIQSSIRMVHSNAFAVMRRQTHRLQSRSKVEKSLLRQQRILKEANRVSNDKLTFGLCMKAMDLTSLLSFGRRCLSQLHRAPLVLPDRATLLYLPRPQKVCQDCYRGALRKMLLYDLN